jgi:hypothetical protein
MIQGSGGIGIFQCLILTDGILRHHFIQFFGAGLYSQHHDADDGQYEEISVFHFALFFR